MIGHLRAWIRERRAARAGEETPRRFAVAAGRGPQPDDLLLAALRRAEPRRRRASRPLGAEPDDATRMAEAEDPLWVRRLDRQIVIMPTLPGSGGQERRADG